MDVMTLKASWGPWSRFQQGFEHKLRTRKLRCGRVVIARHVHVIGEAGFIWGEGDFHYIDTSRDTGSTAYRTEAAAMRWLARKLGIALRAKACEP